MDTTFTFLKHEISLEQGSAQFFYELKANNKTYQFKEVISFPTTGIKNQDLRIKEVLDNLLLVLGVSYWKTFCPQNIQTPTIKLTKEQAIFWNTLYTKGLGEFFYQNKIDFHGLIEFPFVENGSISDRLQAIPPNNYSLSEQRESKGNHNLLFFGGGKDSLVSLELLKQQGKTPTLFVINPKPLHKTLVEQTNMPVIYFSRTIDPQLLELNKERGVYNGHIPATAITDFLGVFAAALYGFDQLIGSNEHSANYGNVEYLGEEINHQWSKSEEFEKLINTYIKTFIDSTINYFSLLRPYYEIKIVEMFSKYSQYFPYFASCNTNFKIHNTKYLIHNTNLWCGECPKCLFIFTLLAAFISKEQLLTIFGKNLFANGQLLSLFKELLGIGKIKPFECVGTPEEMQLALYLTYQKEEYKTDVLMQYFTKEVLPELHNIEQLKTKLL